MLKKWKILSEEDVSPSKWFPILRHVVELPNKKIIDDYFISPFGNAVMVLPFTKTNEMVLVKQYKHGLGEILIELPAGFQQAGKSIEESAIAELLEETGIQTTTDNLEFIGKISNNPTKTNQVTHGFIARNLTFNSVQHFDSTEEIEVLVVKPKQVLEMIGRGELWTGDSVSMILKAFMVYPELF
ncbi:NUDIX hydrolase [Sphingobacteriaceae bacterium]|nr:NUDIX hydrolase [Sphingobacteriaceae bacterium]